MIRNVAPAAPSNISRMTFGQRFGSAAAEAPAQQETAEVWLNVGYMTNDPDYPVVTLPFGIPVDTQKELSFRGNNAKFNAFTKARNGLLSEIQAVAAEMAPGEERIIGGVEDGLVLQLRRRSAEVTADQVDVDAFPAFKLGALVER